MIEFLAFSDMRCSCTEEEPSISSCDIEKLHTLNSAADGCRFIANLGDSLDGKCTCATAPTLLSSILKEFSSNMPVHTLMGERDAVIPKREFIKATGRAMRYSAFDVSDYRCIFLDTCIGAEGDPYQFSNGSCMHAIDDEQLTWISRLLGKSHRPAVIFSHAPIASSSPSGTPIKNSVKLRDIIENSGKVALVISGHAEKSDYVISNGVPYVTLAPLGTQNEISFARVSVSSSGVKVKGFGSQESYSISNKSSKNDWAFLSKLKSIFRK